MGKEQQIRDYVENEIPAEVLNILKSRITTIDDLREITSAVEDSPHQLTHILDVTNIYYYLARACKLNPTETNLGERAIRLHDIGYKLVVLGIIKPEDHHWGSLFVASIIDPDENVLDAIKLHVYDILPENTPLWIRLVRDADRIGALGFTGMNRLATYFNYVDPELDGLSTEDLIQSKVLCNLAPPPNASRILREYLGNGTYKSFEIEAYKYFINKVVPFLDKTGQLDAFAKYLQVLLCRFNGWTPYLTVNEKIYEPVVKEAIRMYELRAYYTELVYDEIHVMTPFRQDGDRAENLRKKLKQFLEQYT